jgi:hypothetical protein
MRTCALSAAAAILGLGAGAPAAAAVAHPTPPTSVEAAELVKWLAANIDSAGWEVADISRTDALFIQPAPYGGGQPGIVRASARWEGFFLPSTGHPWRSALQLLEIDCPNRRFRELSWVAYSGSNFGGEPVANDQAEPNEPWRQPGPGSVMSTAVDRSCAGR